ncbi:MAG: tryptophan--tRNA ligase [Mycoplasmatales bacterium]
MTIFTGIQPSGIITIGNYIGAIKNFKEINSSGVESFMCIVDQHALTIPKSKDVNYDSIKTLVALYIAMGITDDANIFIQSHVPGHTQLAWVLMCFAKNGELERMTQYKDKSSKNISVSAGLFTYPVLMAADILLYDTTHVPVGIDQKQHVELTRDLAEKVNSFYDKDIFVSPECIIGENTKKIYSLTQPEFKMSKSDENIKSYISMLDDESTVLKKLKSATTDSLNLINYDRENQPGVSNLVSIFATFEDISIEQTLEHFKDQGYGFLKTEVARSITNTLKPIQDKYYAIINDQELIDQALLKGTKRANEIANKKIKDVYKEIGFM